MSSTRLACRPNTRRQRQSRPLRRCPNSPHNPGRRSSQRLRRYSHWHLWPAPPPLFPTLRRTGGVLVWQCAASHARRRALACRAHGACALGSRLSTRARQWRSTWRACVVVKSRLGPTSPRSSLTTLPRRPSLECASSRPALSAAKGRTH